MEQAWSGGEPVGELISPACCASRPAPRPFSHTLSAKLATQVRSARELIRDRRDSGKQEPLPTRIQALDQLLGGGLIRGALVELVGNRSSGRFSAVLDTLAATTRGGETTALVDLGDALDPRHAAACGIELNRLLWLRPQRLKEALHGTELLLNGGFQLVVLDLGNPPLRGVSGLTAFWLRLANAARERGAALLVAAPYRVSGPAATAVLRARRARPQWQGRGPAPRLLAGFDGRLTLEKRRGTAAGQTHALPLTHPESAPAAAPAEDRPQAPRPRQPHPAPSKATRPTPAQLVPPAAPPPVIGWPAPTPLPAATPATAPWAATG